MGGTAVLRGAHRARRSVPRLLGLVQWFAFPRKVQRGRGHRALVAAQARPRGGEAQRSSTMSCAMPAVTRT
jgi:hypothetical protein